MKKTIIVMPAFNAEATLEVTFHSIPPEFRRNILLVDDGSTDNTVSIAQRLGIKVIQHQRNRGYGANQKTCYNYALKEGFHYIVMLHPDYQYDPRVIPACIQIIELGFCDVLLGNRIRTRKEALKAGMPPYKYLGNRVLTLLENLVCGENLGEWHSGFRVYRREVLERVPYMRNSDGFLFDSQFLLQCSYMGFILGDIPIPCKYFPEASSIDIKAGMEYAMGTLLYMALYALARTKIYIHPLFKGN